MSDVVATILLLALTVTLFASVFFFINTFPHPPPQPANQFSATLSYGAPVMVGGVLKTPILFVNVLHLAGPTIAGATVVQTAIYLQSQALPSAFAAPFSLASGLNGSTTWALGQSWRENVTSYTLYVPDNVTVSIIAQSQLLFRITLPGASPFTPPIFTQAGTNPAEPNVNAPFTVFVAISDSTLRANSVFVNDSQIPGVTGTGLNQMSFLSSSGLWVYTIPGGSTSSGTFYLFVNATDGPSSLPNSIAIPVTIANSGGSATTLQIQVTADNTAPVLGVPIQLEALVTNNGGSPGTVLVQFYVGGNTVGGPQSQAVGAGATAVYTQSWTSSSLGAQPVQALATMTGASAEGGFSITVFPKILFIAHAYPAGQFPVSNTSADLAQKLTAGGFPFTSMSVACGSALPAAATMKLYGVVIIDFGSATGLTCSQLPPGASEQAKITADATFTNFWLVGSNGFTATTCASYSAAFQTQFGLGTSGTCTASHAASSAATYTSSATSPALRADGVTGLTLSINQTFAGSAAFQPYYSFTTQASGKTWLADSGAKIVGVYTNGSTNHEQLLLGTDPALLTSLIPGGSAYGTASGASAAVVYNAVNFLCGFSTSSNPGRGLPDFGLAGATVFPLKHGLPTEFFVAVRANGPVGGAVFATLYVGGSPAYFGGSLVTGAVTLTGNGAWSWIVLNWTAPAAGTYVLSLGLTSENTDMWLTNNLMPLSYYNSPTTFT